MKISTQSELIEKQIFTEVADISRCFEIEDKNILAISHKFTGQWRGKNLGIHIESLSIYNYDDLSLLYHTDSLKYPVTDICVDKDRNCLIIGTGTYDGGYYYNGSLLRLDLAAGTLQEIWNDCPQIISCSYNNEYLYVTVSPDADEDFAPQIALTYKFSSNENPPFAELTPESIHPFKDESSISYIDELRRVAKQTLVKHASRVDTEFNYYYGAWNSIITSDGKLISTNSEGTILIVNLANKRKKICQPINSTYNNVQVFIIKNRVIVNSDLKYGEYTDQDTGYISEVTLSGKFIRTIKSGQYNLSCCRNGALLFRSTDHTNHRPDYILSNLDSSGKKLNIGHYDLFNHYIQINNQHLLYAIAGRPKNQHRRKVLVGIDPETLLQTAILEIDTETQHYLDINGTIHGTTFIFSGALFNLQDSGSNYEIKAMDIKTGHTVWCIPTENKIVGLTLLSISLNILVILSSENELTFIQVRTGEEICKLKCKKQIAGKPISISSYNNLISIGYSTGTINIITTSIKYSIDEKILNKLK